MGQRILVSGASGFLGKALCKELLAQGHSVITIPRSFLWSIGGLNTLCQKADYIFHLASYGNMAAHTDRQEIIRANIMATLNLLEATKDIPYKGLVYISSSSVKLPVQTLYSSCKKACEEIIKAYDKPIAIVRPYSITGVGEQESHLIPTLIKAAFTGEQVNIVPKPTHDYIDIEDVVRELIGLMDERTPFEDGVFELGSGVATSNMKVLKMIEEVTQKKINHKIVGTLRSYDNDKWLCPYDSSTKPLTQSIEEMVQAYEKRHP
jgi:nucleoside-diphosphate-sugar epimerase